MFDLPSKVLDYSILSWEPVAAREKSLLIRLRIDRTDRTLTMKR